MYAHVATEAAKPGRLSLQYWLWYPFNQWNNNHEGDWEMIQLVFDAPDAQAALAAPPVEVGYSQHEGAESAKWGDEKLELVGGTHPVVYPAAGSHANFFGDALYLGRSAEQGVGCDDTTGPSRELRPVVRVIPTDPEAARKAYPWIAFEGRWGERQRAFLNGPTGPNLKTQWTEPITWSEGWRGYSLAVPAGGLLGTSATDTFCGAVAAGSNLVVKLARNPGRGARDPRAARGARDRRSRAGRAGGRPRRSASRAAARGARRSRRPGGCTRRGRSSSSGSASSRSRSRS